MAASASGRSRSGTRGARRRPPGPPAPWVDSRSRLVSRSPWATRTIRAARTRVEWFAGRVPASYRGGVAVILHADMDAFYASVEQRDRPELRGRPVIVGGTSSRGVVTAASYEARRFGVCSAMPAVQARALCPDAVFLPGDMAKYRRVSAAIRAVFTTIGPGKMVAKIASDLAKPDGLLEVPAGGVTAFLHPLPVGRLWGVGPVTEAALVRAGIVTIGALAARSPAELASAVGASAAEHLVRLATGDDTRAVEPDLAAKSYGEEGTFGADTR